MQDFIKLPDRYDNLLQFLNDNREKKFSMKQIDDLKTGCTHQDFRYLSLHKYIGWDSVGEQSIHIGIEGEVYVCELINRKTELKHKNHHELIMLICTIASAIAAVTTVLLSIVR